jgi:hypothetical protein
LIAPRSLEGPWLPWRNTFAPKSENKLVNHLGDYVTRMR